MGLWGASWAKRTPGAAVGAVLVMLLFGATVPGAADGASCGNESLRLEQGATGLPDCRAFELVSGPRSVPRFENTVVRHSDRLLDTRAAATGGAVAFFTLYAPVGAATADGLYRAERTSTGWVAAALFPPQSTSSTTGCLPEMYLSEDLTAGVLLTGQVVQLETYCRENAPPLITSEPAGWRQESELPYQNLFLRRGLETPAPYSLVDRTPTTAVPASAWLQDTSEDFSRVVFSEQAPLTANAPSGEVLYEWAGGEVHIASVLPDGDPVTGELVNSASYKLLVPPAAAPYTHAVSVDGERLVFTSGGDLYLRVNVLEPQSALGSGGECLEPARACTVQLDASHAGGSGGAGQFLVADRDLSKVFFMDDASAHLTSDTLEGSGENLYEYDVASGVLTDLTPVADAGVDGVSGLGEVEGEGLYLYFVADGALAGGAVSGNCAGGATRESCSMYVEHITSSGASTAFVAPLRYPADRFDWVPAYWTAQTSSNGRYLLFDSAARVPTAGTPSGYDNMDTTSGKPDDEIYRYDAVGEDLECVSCRPGGARPMFGGATLQLPLSGRRLAGYGPVYLPRQASNSGQVFFQTAEPLVEERDTNGVLDVYEYADGAAQLISTGASPDPSLFGEASAEGGDVFFATTQELVPSDGDEAMSLYDARVGGGFPETAEEVACEEPERPCKGAAPAPSPIVAPESVTFSGPGNLEARHSGPKGPAHRASGRREMLRKRLRRALKRCSHRKRKRRCRRAARRRYHARLRQVRRSHKPAASRHGQAAARRATR